MKSNIYSAAKLTCSVSAEDFSVQNSEKTVSSIILNEDNRVATVRFTLEGEAYIVWPNREGEGFLLSVVYNKLARLGFDHCGLSISYPATASMTAFLVKEENGAGFLICMPPESEGRVCEIRILSENSSKVTIKIEGIHRSWFIFKFNNPGELENLLDKQKFSHLNSSAFNKQINIRRQFQLGLIGPDGNTEVPADRGFLIISDVAQFLSQSYGCKGENILHIFGYGAGHDRQYPCYYPSEKLGSVKSLREALKKTREYGFKTSFYLNGRIIEKNCLDIYPQLISSIIKNKDGSYLEESYSGRTFYVMDPGSKHWQDCLVSWTEKLADYGADAVQLDQLGGRAAAKKAGEIWGEGYCEIIDRIHKTGMYVWIQGVSDLYNADWFEMTFRELNILDDGVIRGGNPFGETDLSLVELFLKDKTFLMTESKKEKIENINNYNVITDLPDFRGELPLYSAAYFDHIIQGNCYMNREKWQI